MGYLYAYIYIYYNGIWRFSNPLVMDFRDIMEFNLCDVYIYIYTHKALD